MSKITFKDRIVEFPGRVKLTPVSGQPNVYDVSRQEGTITQQGTTLNAIVLNSLRQKEDPPETGHPTRAYVVFDTGDGYLNVTSGWDANSIVQRNFRGTFEIPTPQEGWDIHSVATKELFDIADTAITQLSDKVDKLTPVTTLNVEQDHSAIALGSKCTLRVRLGQYDSGEIVTVDGFLFVVQISRSPNSISLLLVYLSNGQVTSRTLTRNASSSTYSSVALEVSQGGGIIQL